MKPDALKKIISECIHDVTFVCDGKQSGVTSEVHDSVPTFQAWHADDTKEYSSIDDVMDDKFYGGKSLNDLSENLNFEIL